MPNKPQGKGSEVPRELEGAATAKDVNVLEEKIGKSYSAERYEEFHEAVKKITLETIDSGEGRTKIKSHAKESTKEFLAEDNWKKIVFWIPVVISIVTTGVAVWAVIHSK